MLDIIEAAFTREGVRTVRLDGSMSKKARDRSLGAFRKDWDVRRMEVGPLGCGHELTSDDMAPGERVSYEPQGWKLRA